jgi:hypothetical protein
VSYARLDPIVRGSGESRTGGTSARKERAASGGFWYSRRTLRSTMRRVRNPSSSTGDLQRNVTRYSVEHRCSLQIVSLIFGYFDAVFRYKTFQKPRTEFYEFATTHAVNPDVPAVADGDDGYGKSTKIALLSLKEEFNKPLPAV